MDLPSYTSTEEVEIMHISSLGGTKVQIVLTYLSLTYAEPLTTASIRVSGTGLLPAARGRFSALLEHF